MTNYEKLRALADWFDAYDTKRLNPMIGDDVQKDLRAMANEFEQLHKHNVSSRFLADLNFIIENMGYDLVKNKVSPEAQKEYLKRLKMMRDELSENDC